MSTSQIPTPHIEAKAGDFAKTVLMPGDPLRARFIAETFLEHPILVNNVRGIQGYTGAYQGKRISVRAVQNLVKKYAHGVTAKNITPHKLRSTYGTNLYQETGDIYLVADTLGHADVNTTRKHYAEIEENRRKRAASYILSLIHI